MKLDELVAIAQHHAATVYRSNGTLKSVIVPAEAMIAIVDILGEHSTCGIRARDVVVADPNNPGKVGVLFEGGAVEDPADLRVLLTMYLRACDIADERNQRPQGDRDANP